jgi:hypothetical protein
MWTASTSKGTSSLRPYWTCRADCKEIICKTPVRVQRQSHGDDPLDHQPLSHRTEFQSSNSPTQFHYFCLAIIDFLRFSSIWWQFVPCPEREANWPLHGKLVLTGLWEKSTFLFKHPKQEENRPLHSSGKLVLTELWENIKFFWHFCTT